MPVRRGDEFLASVRDGRQVWLDGERVDDVTAHPRLAGCARAVAEVYDLQHDSACRDLLTIESPTGGGRVGRGYVLPQNVDDLVRRREMIEFLMRRCGATLGRLPEYMASIVVGLYDVRATLAESDPAFADHAAEYLAHCRENDLCLTHGFADPPRDASLPRTAFENLRVVEERTDGVVIRGVKSVATLAPYANEYLGLAPNRPGLAAAEIVYFAVPLAHERVRVVCRSALANADAANHPLSAAYDEMDAWVVFDDVFVPKRRVFYLQRTEIHQDLLNRILAWAFWHILIRMAVKAEVLAGIGAALADYLGVKGQQHVQLALCELIGYAEILRAFIYAAERDPIESASGLCIPNPTQITLGRIFSVDHHPRILQLVRELSGSGILMAPGAAEMDDPTLRPDIDRYLIGADTRAPERFRLLKLAWEYTCESFGGRQLLFEMHNAGSQLATKARLVATYDATPHIHLAKALAGIEAASPPPADRAASVPGAAGRRS